MCTVFAESVVSLIAQNKATDDTAHGLNSRCIQDGKTGKRVGGEMLYDDRRRVRKNRDCEDTGREAYNIGDQ